LPDTQIMIDLHWKYEAAEAVGLITTLAQHGLSFAEAPCKPEDIAGLAFVAHRAPVPIAAGEEWRTVHDAVPRLASRAVSIVQPEMGHTGITQFRRICVLAEANHLHVAPHSTIGCGIFLTASLQVSATLRGLRWHEHQHSLFDASLEGLEGDLAFEDGGYRLPTGPGLGVEPKKAVLDRAISI
jgi:galactonate dehydratase